ncbi:heparinase II/III domain-containing protein [Sorangium sp. So ce1000]|uniref:heparinase II/III domain-containing protein n=1 Tax=Sorangium sp. So ce1000 TaxID=3133325 RepID=UPI003F62B54F
MKSRSRHFPPSFRTHGLTRAALACVALAAAACGPDASEASEPRDTGVHPRLLARPEHRDVLRSRVDREPYASILATLKRRADRPYEEEPDPASWDHVTNGNNASTAQANALLAWAFEDRAAADKAREFLRRLQSNWDTNTVLDINIRMAKTLMGYTNAWDLLSATPWFPAEESALAERKITDITGQFFAKYLEQDFYRDLLLRPAQNNHPIRTADAIGYVALAFPEHPAATTWWNWSISELDYLWGPDGQYVQPDGGASEGPYYSGFAWGPTAAFFIALDNALAGEAPFTRDCRTRSDEDPWAGHGCVDGEQATLDVPLRGGLFTKAVDWSLSLRLPWGSRPPVDDGVFTPFNGSPLLTSFGGGGEYLWDWEQNRDPEAMEFGGDLIAHHLIYVDDAVAPEAPRFLTRFFPDTGHAVFRSDWGDEARWLLLLAEHGSARKAIHDHVDGTSFSLAAYGEYLLIDAGYYKPDALDNAKTSQSPSHNVILIDGRSAPDKGLFDNFGDADAFLRNTHDGEAVDYAEAHQDYQDTHVERSVAFIDGRYFVVGDRLSTSHPAARAHAWRLHGYAGLTSGGTFELLPDGGRWERARAGVVARVQSTAPGLAVVEPPYTPLTVPHVHEFEEDREAADHAVIDATVEAEAPGFLAVLLPYKVGVDAGPDAPLQAEPIEAGPGVVAWQIESDGGTDVAVLRREGAPEKLALPGGQVLETDAQLVVLRIEGERPFALMARGTRVLVDGDPRVTAPDATGVAVEE